MKQKPKIKKNKLDYNPLFIKFLNWKGDKYTVENWLEGLTSKFEDSCSLEKVKNRMLFLDDEYLNTLSNFQNNFKKYVSSTLLSQSVDEIFLAWLGSAFNYISEEIEFSHKEEIRKIKIKEVGEKWFEAIICYNFIMTFNYFGVSIIKQCPVCKNYFSHKGKYAKYCSESCKGVKS